jgi:hypothetical protein
MSINPFFTFTEWIRYIDAMPPCVCVYTLLPDLVRRPASLQRRSKTLFIALRPVVVRTADKRSHEALHCATDLNTVCKRRMRLWDYLAHARQLPCRHTVPA